MPSYNRTNHSIQYKQSLLKIVFFTPNQTSTLSRPLAHLNDDHVRHNPNLIITTNEPRVHHTRQRTHQSRSRNSPSMETHVHSPIIQPPHRFPRRRLAREIKHRLLPDELRYTDSRYSLPQSPMASNLASRLGRSHGRMALPLLPPWRTDCSLRKTRQWSNHSCSDVDSHRCSASLHRCYTQYHHRGFDRCCGGFGSCCFQKYSWSVSWSRRRTFVFSSWCSGFVIRFIFSVFFGLILLFLWNLLMILGFTIFFFLFWGFGVCEIVKKSNC